MVEKYLHVSNSQVQSTEQKSQLQEKLDAILVKEYDGNMFALMAEYTKILTDNQRRKQWSEIHGKLDTLFQCGKYSPLSGPMIGVSVTIRNSDYFKDVAQLCGKERSALANVEFMASCWNATFADTGLWMGKTFEDIPKERIKAKLNNWPKAYAKYNKEETKFGRNFFRQPVNPNALQAIGLPALTRLWNLKDRPLTPETQGFDALLSQDNLDREKVIPYSKTGGYFLATRGKSIVPELMGKTVYQLDYRWGGLKARFPMTRLIDEIVQIDEGIYLGQLVFATKNFSLGVVEIPLWNGKTKSIALGREYDPFDDREGFIEKVVELFTGDIDENVDYGYQNNGYFLMMDPQYAEKIYADKAFPLLKPHFGEFGYAALNDALKVSSQSGMIPNLKLSERFKEIADITDWKQGWVNNQQVKQKFTTFTLEESPKSDDLDEVKAMLKDGESILQMLQRIKDEISDSTCKNDNLEHFEKLNKLFRCGIAPKIIDGKFTGVGKPNVRFDASESRTWYGLADPCRGFDYYHGATLNLHWGFSDTYAPEKLLDEQDNATSFPGVISDIIAACSQNNPNVLNAIWAAIGRFIFPWAGKTFETITPQKLSVFLDESDDLHERYPQRVKELRNHLASRPHYDLVKKNKQHYWEKTGPFMGYLKNGPWHKGMTDKDKEFWQTMAQTKWVYGTNIQDKRILPFDLIFKMLDMNYGEPLDSIQELANEGPSPFVRQGYIFLGNADQDSILPMNNSDSRKKKVFQFQYRFPLIGGAAPIGLCLDEIVEIAQGLYLGQLIYSTVPFKPFHSSVEPAEYHYQLFGYFLLIDDTWECHRLAIDLDTWK